MTLRRLAPHTIADAVAAALKEDLGETGDITTLATVSPGAMASASIRVREPGVICGLDLARAAFLQLELSCTFRSDVDDGASVEAGSTIARVDGPAAALLSAERVALNFLGHLSGIATATRAFADKVAGTGARIVDTRKTTPGLRALEKYAVVCGGGHNHRTGLFDAVMIKDNHIVAAGGIERAILGVTATAGHMVTVEVEVDTLAQLDEVLAHADAVDAVLLDNMDLVTLKRAVELVDGRLICEASGGVSLDTVADIAGTGVDIISVGALTHSARSLDVGLDFAAEK